ncbi:protein disulfide-isomerase TMX3-like isoform X2 [Varroa jacobsoni]|uniref:Thioredoxin domain-containing protein n=1 Tax=Varroa destructor TaxID=109461 RepID=A0A7M7K5V5_VARDE|nr:protein disulfide-isomerase TMX3-like isoform X2 [Varroa destructor]XP_022692165.1 protein disulfide-isomerase TMX3-like isoform X2 [Varroa jacobsoni]
MYFHIGVVSALLSASLGRVIELSDRFLEIKNREVWLIKFYAPWCGHCKQLEPVWSQVSQRLVDTDIRVSRLDCTKYTSIAQQFRVSGFPTIMYINKDKQVEYRGERTITDILDFARRVHGPSVRKLTTCENMRNVLQAQPAVFVLAAHPEGHVGAEEVVKNFSDHADHMHAHNYFIQVPLSCIDESKRTSTVIDSRFGTVEQWILSERFPAFQRVTHGNFNQLLGTRKLLVAAVLEENQIGKLETLRMADVKDMLEALAVNTQNLYHEKFLFGWFPSTDIPYSIAMTELPLPSVMVIDPHTYRYFLPENAEDPQAIIRLLDDILKNDPEPSSYGGNTFFYRIYRSYFEMRQNLKNMYRSSPVLTVIIFLVPMGFFSAIVYLTCCADLFDAPGDAEDLDEDDEHEKND